METTTPFEAPPTLLLTLTEVATHLRCTRRSVERQVAHHALHVIRFGRSVRVERSELERFIARQRELADAG
jgi:excisionase family DNA binding protein